MSQFVFTGVAVTLSKAILYPIQYWKQVEQNLVRFGAKITHPGVLGDFTNIVSVRARLGLYMKLWRVQFVIIAHVFCRFLASLF